MHTELADALPEISADPDLLHRALQNLVLNAIDAMPQGGELAIRTATLGDRIEISVSDTGSGLTQEECERLFTPYYTTKQHGTGLGPGDCAVGGERSRRQNFRREHERKRNDVSHRICRANHSRGKPAQT